MKKAGKRKVFFDSLLPAIADALPQTIWTARRDGSIDYISLDSGIAASQPVGQLVGEGWLTSIHPDDREPTRIAWQHSISSGEGLRIEVRFFNAEKQQYEWHDVRANALQDASGNTLKWYGTSTNIHQHHMAHEQLRQERSDHRQILAAVSEGVHRIDTDGNVTFENPASRALLHFDRGELIGRHLHSAVHHHFDGTQDHGADDCPIMQTLLDGQRRHLEKDTFLRKDGSAFPVEYTATATRDALTGTITGAVISFRDITRRLRQQGLRRLETNILKRVSAGAPLGSMLDELTRTVDELMPGSLSSVKLVDGDRLTVAAGPGLPQAYAASMNGLQIGEGEAACGTAAFRKKLVVVTGLDTHPHFHACRELVSALGCHTCWSLPIFDSEGNILATFAMYFRTAKTPCPLDREFIERIGEFIQMAIERSQQRDQLALSEERLSLVIQSTNDVVWDRDFQQDTFWWSESLYKQFGHQPESLPDRPEAWHNLIHPDDSQRVIEKFKQVCEGTDTCWDDEYRLRCGTGGFAIVRDRGQILRDQHGKAVRAVGSISDTTERRKLEEELRQVQRLDAIGKLTGGIAHDFNNLLTVILGNAELIADALETDTSLYPLASMTQQAAEKGAALTSRLLAFSRRQPLNPTTLDVNQLLTEFEPLLRRTLGEQVELKLQQCQPLWRAIIDASQLENAILNLAVNARDAMPAGGQLRIETSNVSVEEREETPENVIASGRYIGVTVSDTGTGMDAETLSRAFDPFYTTKDSSKGTGLGLSMVYGFAIQSGGYVSMDSRPGDGTDVRLLLPATENQVSNTMHELMPTTAPTGRETVLLVEDDPLVREHAEYLLKSLGYSVISAGNGPEALRAVGTDVSVDLIFTDMVMPGGMTGRALADKLAETRPGIPVLYTSGYSETTFPAAERSSDSAVLLPKPYRRSELATMVREVLDGTSIGFVDTPSPGSHSP